MKTARKLFALILVVLLLAAAILPVIASSDNGDTLVYVTDTGKKYHREFCGYLRSKHEITLREAAERGYQPCSRCSPPVFNGTIIRETESPSKSSSKSSSEISSKNADGEQSLEAKQNLPSSSKSKSSIFDAIWDWFWIVVAVGIILFYLVVWIVGIVTDRWVYGPDGKRIKKRRK